MLWACFLAVQSIICVGFLPLVTLMQSAVTALRQALPTQPIWYARCYNFHDAINCTSKHQSTIPFSCDPSSPMSSTLQCLQTLCSPTEQLLRRGTPAQRCFQGATCAPSTSPFEEQRTAKVDLRPAVRSLPLLLRCNISFC